MTFESFEELEAYMAPAIERYRAFNWDVEWTRSHPPYFHGIQFYFDHAYSWRMGVTVRLNGRRSFIERSTVGSDEFRIVAEAYRLGVPSEFALLRRACFNARVRRDEFSCFVDFLASRGVDDVSVAWLRDSLSSQFFLILQTPDEFRRPDRETRWLIDFYEQQESIKS